ncbi:diacylglycerol/lipid kinase family protein [Roseococcus sp. DSY-14]|uniref:diacylglycerol/lipid kinase family protein n=1 Tax=Roseococcus sp. DSY-14 TaxID=3369650 RepID=UPI00387AA051
MKAALILNTRAGRLAQMEAPRAAIEAAMRAGGFDPLPLPDGDLDAQWAAAQGAEAVFICGGDGTLRGFAKRLMAAGLPFAPLPGGTMNRVCTRLGLPDDPVAAAALYRPGPPEPMAAALLNGEPLLYQSLIGRPARMLRFREMQREGGSWWPLLKAGLRVLFRAPWRDVTVPVGPDSRATGLAAVVTLPEPGEAPALTMQLVRALGPLARLRQAWAWFRGRLGEDSGVVTLHAPRFVVHGRARRMRVSLDGEMRTVAPPLRYRLKPGALRVLPRA